MLLYVGELSLDAIKIFSEKRKLTENSGIGLLSAVFNEFLQLIDLSLYSCSRLTSAVRCKPEDISRVLEDLTYVEHPNVVLHHRTELLHC